MERENIQERSNSLAAFAHITALLSTILLTIPRFVALFGGESNLFGFSISSPAPTSVMAILILASYAFAFWLIVSKKIELIWIPFCLLSVLHLLEFAEPMLDKLAVLIFEPRLSDALSGLLTEEINLKTIGIITENLIYLFSHALTVSTPLWCALGFLFLSSFSRKSIKNNTLPRKKIVFPLLLQILALITVTIKMVTRLVILLAEGSYLYDLVPFLIAYTATLLILIAHILFTTTLNKLLSSANRSHENNVYRTEGLK